MEQQTWRKGIRPQNESGEQEGFLEDDPVPEFLVEEHEARRGDGGSGEKSERYRFYQGLYAFLRSLRMVPKAPIIAGKTVDFYRLYAEVLHLGGADTVTASKLWKRLSDLFKYPPSVTSAGWILRKHYYAFLYAYEKHYYWGQRAPAADSRRLRAQPSSDRLDNASSTTASSTASSSAAAAAMVGDFAYSDDVFSPKQARTRSTMDMLATPVERLQHVAVTALPSHSKRLASLRSCSHTLHERLARLLDSPRHWEVSRSLSLLLLASSTRQFSLMHGPELACVHSDPQGLRYSVLEALARLYSRLLSMDLFDEHGSSDADRSCPDFSPSQRASLRSQTVLLLRNLSDIHTNQQPLGSHLPTVSLMLSVLVAASSSPHPQEPAESPSLSSPARSSVRWHEAPYSAANLEAALFFVANVVSFIPYQYLSALVQHLTPLVTPLAFADHLLLIIRTFEVVCSRVAVDFFSMLPDELFQRIFGCLFYLSANPVSHPAAAKDDDDLDRLLTEALLQFTLSVLRTLSPPMFCRFVSNHSTVVPLIAASVASHPAAQDILFRLLEVPEGWHLFAPHIPSILDSVHSIPTLHLRLFDSLPSFNQWI